MLLSTFGVLIDAIACILFFKIYKGVSIKPKTIWLVILLIAMQFIVFSIIMSVFAYLIYWVLVLLIMRVFYKDINIIDFFMFTLYWVMALIISASTFFGIKNFAISFILNYSFLIASIILLKKPLTKVLAFYNKNWNRGKDNSIKSITMRHISLLGFHLVLIILSLVAIYKSSH